MASHEFLVNSVIFLSAAAIAVPISKKLGLGSVLGYLAAGSIIGPWGLRLITEVDAILHFAELGVVLLLFIIGLELKPSRLWNMRKDVFGTGTLQVLVTSGLFAAFTFSRFGFSQSMIIGVTLALSSTAFAMQLLVEKNQLNTHHGAKSFSILLFQDLAAIPLLAIIPILGSKGVSSTTPSASMAALQSSTAIVGIILVGRTLLRPILRLIAGAKTREVFTAAALLLVLGIALVMEAVGLSMALGAFLAGVLLADSEYRHQLEADLEPFKGLLLGLFFISVGMSVNYGLILTQTLPIIGLVLGVLLVKMTVLFALGRVNGLGHTAARILAITLSQGGEFGFVLFGIAANTGVLPRSTTSLLTVVIILTMTITPFLYLLNEKVLSRLSQPEEKKYDDIQNEGRPVIVAGYGRVGQIASRILSLQGIEVTALEHDPDQVEVVRKFGRKIYYGDASRVDLLEAAGAHEARALILAIDKPDDSVRAAKVIRENFPHLKIFARARNRAHAFDLMDLNVQVIVRETFDASLKLAGEVLKDMKVPETTIDLLTKTFTEHDEATLKNQYNLRHDQNQMIQYSKDSVRQLEEVLKADHLS